MAQHARSEVVSAVVAQPARKACVTLETELCGEVYKIDPGDTFTIGRVGTLAIEDNPLLHRDFFVIESYNDLWWISNAGSCIAVTVAETTGMFQSWIGPGSQIPLAVPNMSLVFTTGPTTHEMDMMVPDMTYEVSSMGCEDVGETTIGQVTPTPSQRLPTLALTENWLRWVGTGPSDIPCSEEVAQRFGWTQTRFNHKLDNVCKKLDRPGVRGPHGGKDVHATCRRARLVKYAVASRLVTADDLMLLDEEFQTNRWQKAAEGSRRSRRHG